MEEPNDIIQQNPQLPPQPLPQQQAPTSPKPLPQQGALPQQNPQPPTQQNPRPPPQQNLQQGAAPPPQENPQPLPQQNPQPPPQQNPQPPPQPPPQQNPQQGAASPPQENPQPLPQQNPQPPPQQNPRPTTQQNPQQGALPPPHEIPQPPQQNPQPPPQQNPQQPPQQNPQPPPQQNPQPPPQQNPQPPPQQNPQQGALPPPHEIPQPVPQQNPQPPQQNPQPPPQQNPQQPPQQNPQSSPQQNPQPPPQQNPQQGALPPPHEIPQPLPQQNPQPPQQNLHPPPQQNPQPPPQQNPQPPHQNPQPPPQENPQPPQQNPQQGAPQNPQPPAQQNPQPGAPPLPPQQNPRPPPQNQQQGALSAPPQQNPPPPPQQNPQQGAPPQQNPQLPAPPPLHPIRDLLDGRRRDFIDICVPLYNALMRGDWEAAQLILNGRQNLLRSSITENLETPLHVAASAESNTKSIKIVQNLVNIMDPADLRLQNNNGNTALSLAATSGNVKIANIMMMKNRELPTIPNNEGMMPLYIAVMFRNPEMVNCLYEESQQLRGRGWTPTNRRWLFLKSIEAELFDFALRILNVCPELAQTHDVLANLARNPSAFNEVKPNFFRGIVNSIFCSKVESVDTNAMKILKKIWTNIEEKPKVEIDRILRGPTVMRNRNIQTHPKRILFIAAERGNTMFLAELIRRYPDLIWKQNDDGLSIFHVAVSHLHENIYNLLYEIGSMKGLITPYTDREKNNMLHLVGKKPEKSQLQGVSGVAFQVQRKLLWFKEVESMIPPHYKEKENSSGLTPYQLFTENHKALVSEGEKWMKGTASKCMVVAALIATVVFTVAYTIPGGYEQNNNNKIKAGFPVFLHNGPFLAFVILDAISLIFSSASILVFLSILTSRYAQEDFIESLPRYLLVGLIMLFFSVVAMMISFSVSFYVIYRGKFIAIAIAISVLALLPIAVYAKLQFPLLKDVFRSTYGRSYLFKPKKRMLYYQNPRF